MNVPPPYALPHTDEEALELGRARASAVLESLDRSGDDAKLWAEERPVLLAEGDSWFDYPFFDVTRILEDEYGYDVESVARAGHPVEEMAYGEGHLLETTRRLSKILSRGSDLRAILLSGGGNDVAGRAFKMLLEHADSPSPGLNKDIVDAVVDGRVRASYVTILEALAEITLAKTGLKTPVVVHGYARPVPDGRGYLGGWGPLPGPWLAPGFREKGYGHDKLESRALIAGELIDRFNDMLESLAALPAFDHVHYVDLRDELPASIRDGAYKKWWDNELHPTKPGFGRVAAKFDAVLSSLP